MHIHQYAHKEDRQVVPEIAAQPQVKAEEKASSPVGGAMLRMQSRRGNHYVQQVVGELHAAPALDERPRLRVGRPGDRYEQEADRAAARVMRRLAAPASGQARLAASEPARGLVSLKAGPEAGAGPVSPELQQAIAAERGHGRALPEALRERMEQAFDADFEGVRLHTGGQADRLSQALHAQAFTTGQDIFFRREAFQPASPKGVEILAHELAHVVQQQGDLIQGYFDLQDINEPELINGYVYAHYRYDDPGLRPDEYVHLTYEKADRTDGVVHFYYNIRTGRWRKTGAGFPVNDRVFRVHKRAAIAWANGKGMLAKIAALAPAPAPVQQPLLAANYNRDFPALGGH